MTDLPEEHMDPTVLPLTSWSNTPVETQDAASSTFAMPFAEPSTIAASKSSAQRQREYRQRIAASRTPAQSIATRISETERKRNYRLRKAANLALASSSLKSGTESSSCQPTVAAPKSSAQRQREYRQRIAASRTPAQSIATRISETERKRNYRLRKAANLALATLVSSLLESSTESSSRSAGRSNDVQNSTQKQLTNQQRQSVAAEPAHDQVLLQIKLKYLTSLWTSRICHYLQGRASATQGAAASTSAAPFAEPPTIVAPKSSAQRQREYRQRIAASRTPAQSIAMRISETERKRNYRLHKAANLALASDSLESTTASSSSSSARRSKDVQNVQFRMGIRC